MRKGVLSIRHKLFVYVLAWVATVMGTLWFVTPPVHAATGINGQINFQGRLLNAFGATVPDGYYNVQFKIYQDGDGLSANNSTGSPASTLLWTENYLNNNSQGVTLKNGFMSVQLGSINPFGSSIDWNQDTLWLSINVGNTNGSCTPFASCSGDGEMLPMKRLTAVPYAMNAGRLGGLTSSSFVQLGQAAAQTDSSSNTAISINKTASGNFLNLQSSSTDVLTVTSTGDVTFGANANHTISVATSAATVAGKNLTVSAGAAGTGGTALAGGNLVLQGGAGGGTDGNGGNIVLDAGVKNGTGTDGTISIGVTTASAVTISKTGVTTTIGGNLTVGALGTAGIVTNTSGGVIGTIATVPIANGGTNAATSQDAINNISQLTTQGDLLYHNGTNSTRLARGSDTQCLTSNATTILWGSCAQSIGTFSNTSTANGLDITSGVLTLHAADGSNPGAVSTTTQTFAGNKTLTGATVLSPSASGVAALTINPGATTNDGLVIQGPVGYSASALSYTVSGLGYNMLNVDYYGRTVFRPSTDTADTFRVKNAAGTNLFGVDSSASTVNVGGSLVVTYDAQVRNLTFDTSTSISYVTPDGASVPTKINVPNFDPGGFGQVVAMGVPSTAQATARVLSLFDDRATAHQPTLAVFNTAESDVIGFSWDGGSVGLIKSLGSDIGVNINGTTAATFSTTSLTVASTVTTAAATAMTIDSGTTGQLNIGTGGSAKTIQIGSTILSSGTQTINIGNNNTSGGTTNVTIGSGSSATGGTTALQAKNNITITTNGVVRGTFDTSNGLYLGNGVTAAAPNAFTLSGTGSSTTAVAGGALTIQGGNATVGNANGGNLLLSGGTGVGSGVTGLVVLSTPTFSTTANDANCYTGGALVASTCTIATSSVNNSAAIIVGFSATGQTANLPDPTTATAGRVVYITAANGSSDFTLVVNGGGTGNSIAMRQNTTATMIWNGNDWTAAGASSSTTLQSAYDNTLQSAGGAELIVSSTSTTKGLTIRDSSVNPVNGTLVSVQTQSAAVLFSVNSNVTEYSTNGGAETAGGTSSTFPASTWSAVGSSTVSRYTTVGNFIAVGQASASTVTTTAANDGIKNTLSTTLTANNHYNVSFTTRLSSGTFTDMNVYYSINGTTASVACITTGQAVTTSIWTKVNCAFTAPSSGITSSNAILIRQTGSGTARTFYVDNLSVTIAADFNYATDGSVDDSGNFTTNWTAVASSSVTHSTTIGNDASDSAQVVTTTSNQGVRNKLSINPLTSTIYRLTAYAASTTSGFNTFTVRYSRDGGTNFTACADYNTQAISSSTTTFTKVTCYVTTDGTSPTNPYVYFTQTDATGRTWYVDTFSMTLTSNTTPNVQIGGGVNGGPATLFTVDRAASAPIASNNDAFLGSMYYDTSLGKLQCYEADGWGACGSSPDNIVTISPEYTNAVLHGTGVGTMTSDICSDTLNINDGSSGQATICGTNETYNFYKWTSPQGSAQTYSLYVTYQLPTTFKSFSSGQTSLMGRTDSASATVQYSVYRNSSSGLSQCGATVSVSTGSVSSWQTGIASGAADPSTCDFAAGNSIVFKIDVIASSNANAYVGNLGFTFSNN